MLIEYLLFDLDMPAESIRLFSEKIINKIEDRCLLDGESDNAKFNREILSYNYGILALSKQILAVLKDYQRQVNENYENLETN